MKLKKTKIVDKKLDDAESNVDSEYINILKNTIESNCNVITFLHNTEHRKTADKILKEGFEFQSYLDFTTDVVTAKDVVAIKYFTIVRQAYGKFTIVIQISKQLINEYSHRLENVAHHFSEVLSVKEPYLGDEDDMIYCLAPHFIKGYINAETGELFLNPNFNASLKIPIFEENLKKI